MNHTLQTFDPTMDPTPVALELMSGQIELTIAVKDIDAILKHPKLGNIVTPSIGGSIPKELFFDGAITDTDAGVMMWYCYNNDGSNPSPRLFLKMEMVHLKNIESKTFASQELKTPTEIFAYNGNKDLQSVRQYIRTKVVHPFRYLFPIGINAFSTVDLNQNFASMQIDEYGEKFNTRPWAYFQNNKNDGNDTEGLLNRLVNQKGAVYIHYYFGYDEGILGKNRIRVILIAADKDHNPLMEVIVQRSTPPAAIRAIK